MPGRWWARLKSCRRSMRHAAGARASCVVEDSFMREVCTHTEPGRGKTGAVGNYVGRCNTGVKITQHVTTDQPNEEKDVKCR